MDIIIILINILVATMFWNCFELIPWRKLVHGTGSKPQKSGFCERYDHLLTYFGLKHHFINDENNRFFTELKV